MGVDMDMNVMEQYKKAINFTGDLSKGQKIIMNNIVSFGQDKGVTVETIQKVTDISRQAASVHLQRLMKRNFVFRKKDRIYKYIANEDRLNELLREYLIAEKLKK